MDFHPPHQGPRTIRPTPEASAVSGTPKPLLCEIHFSSLTDKILLKRAYDSPTRGLLGHARACPLPDKQNSKPTEGTRGAGCPGESPAHRPEGAGGQGWAGLPSGVPDLPPRGPPGLTLPSAAGVSQRRKGRRVARFPVSIPSAPWPAGKRAKSPQPQVDGMRGGSRVSSRPGWLWAPGESSLASDPGGFKHQTAH